MKKKINLDSRDIMWLIIANVCILGLTFGFILYSLTFKMVPVEESYTWYGQNLHTYLCVHHAQLLGAGIILDALANFLLIKNF